MDDLLNQPVNDFQVAAVLLLLKKGSEDPQWVSKAVEGLLLEVVERLGELGIGSEGLEFVAKEDVADAVKGELLKEVLDLNSLPQISGPAKLVMIVLPGDKDDSTKLQAVRLAYVKRFHQQSVLLMTHGDCVSF